jgi:anti-sigma regulatory factor (Ser/Thr protein kinase)
LKNLGIGVFSPAANSAPLPSSAAILGVAGDGRSGDRGRLLALAIKITDALRVGVAASEDSRSLAWTEGSTVSVMAGHAEQALVRYRQWVPPRGESIRYARWRSADVLERAGVPKAQVRDVELLIAELLTNAMRYGCGPVSELLVALYPSGTVLVAVTDSGERRTPERSRTRRDDESDPGILLVAEYAKQWGFEEQAAGKTVWATYRTELARSGGDRADETRRRSSDSTTGAGSAAPTVPFRSRVEPIHA